MKDLDPKDLGTGEAADLSDSNVPSAKLHRAIPRWKRNLLIVLGLFFVGLGFLGIVTPVLPTTPFLLLAAGMLANASPRLHAWLHENRITGAYIKAYTQGAGMSRRRKVSTIAILWATLAVSGYFTRHLWWVLLILGCVGIGVTIHIATIRSKRDDSTNEKTDRNESGRPKKTNPTT